MIARSREQHVPSTPWRLERRTRSLMQRSAVCIAFSWGSFFMPSRAAPTRRGGGSEDDPAMLRHTSSKGNTEQKLHNHASSSTRARCSTRMASRERGAPENGADERELASGVDATRRHGIIHCLSEDLDDGVQPLSATGNDSGGYGARCWQASAKKQLAIDRLLRLWNEEPDATKRLHGST